MHKEQNKIDNGKKGDLFQVGKKAKDARRGKGGKGKRREIELLQMEREIRVGGRRETWEEKEMKKN